MQLHRLVRSLKPSLEFSLLLLLTGSMLWGASGWFTQQVFSQTHGADAQVDTTGARQVSISFAVSILAIDAEIDRSLKMTEVNIRTSGSSLQEMEFEYPLTEYAEIEAAIAQDLGLSSSDVRNLIRYRVD